MHNPASPLRHGSDRENRLLNFAEQSRWQKFTNWAENKVHDTFENYMAPDAARERSLIGDREAIAAYSLPGLFTRTDKEFTANMQADRLLAMKPERRLQEFQRYVDRNFTGAIRNREELAYLFAPELNALDLENYKNDERSNRIATLLRALKILSGEDIPQSDDPIAFLLARECLQNRNNTAAAPGGVYNLYKKWLDENPQLGRTDATTPETLLKPDSGIPDKLRGALLNLIEPIAQATFLREMYETYTDKNTDTRLERAQQTVDFLKLNKSVQETNLRRESADFLTNFQNADGKVQLLTVAAGLFLGYKAFNAKNPLGRLMIWGGFGWWAYDRFINGNENALNDMTTGMKRVAQFSGEKFKDAIRATGLPVFRRPLDKLGAMGDFLEKNKLPVGPAMTGMATMSGVKLKTIADAFVPFDEGETLGGTLSIDRGDRMGTEQEADPAGNMLARELKAAMDKMGLKSTEKEATFRYLLEHNRSVSEGVGHVFYLLAASETHNIKTADEIGKQIDDTGSYDKLPAGLKKRYQQMVIEGRQIAIDRHANQSLVEIVDQLNARAKREKEKAQDTAVLISNPRQVKGRENEWKLLGQTAAMTADKISDEKLTDTDGLLEKDIDEFLRNCKDSDLLTPDGSEELKRKFDIIRGSDSPLTDRMQAVEKLKYAVTVTAAAEENPLDRDKIIQMTGPDDRTPKAYLAQAEGYISRYLLSVPRSFHSVNSLGDIRSMLSEPWLGEGPVTSGGEGFKELKKELDTEEAELKEHRNQDKLVKDLADALPQGVTTIFKGKDKLMEALAPIISASNFKTRLDHAEANLSQRMALALARSQRLNATAGGYGRRYKPGITPNEKSNLVHEFRALFDDIVGRDQHRQAMWGAVEDIEANNLHDLDSLYPKSFDYTQEPNRLEAIGFSRNITLVYLLRLLGGRADAELKKSAGERVKLIYANIFRERDDLIKSKMEEILYADTAEKKMDTVEEKNRKSKANSDNVQLIENMPSFKNGLPELYDILIILEMTGGMDELTDFKNPKDSNFKKDREKYFPKIEEPQKENPAEDEEKDEKDKPENDMGGGAKAKPGEKKEPEEKPKGDMGGGAKPKPKPGPAEPGPAKPEPPLDGGEPPLKKAEPPLKKSEPPLEKTEPPL